MSSKIIEEDKISELEETVLCLKNCISKIKEAYPNFVTINNKLAKDINTNFKDLKNLVTDFKNSEDSEDFEKLEEQIEELEEERDELENNLIHFHLFEDVVINSVYDELKVKTLLKAYEQYELHELEDLLNVSYI